MASRAPAPVLRIRDPLQGISETGDFLAGYGFEGDSQCAGWASGENDNLSAVDLTNKVVGTPFSAKGRFDAWVQSYAADARL